jgi:hypothetical protein
MAGIGFLVGVVGGLVLFWPFIQSTGIDGRSAEYSIWQAHDLCSTFLGAFAPTQCSTDNVLWFVGVALVAVGGLMFFRGALGYSSSTQLQERRGPMPEPKSGDEARSEAMQTLQSLKAMHQSGLITDTEYEAKRSEVVSRL